MPHLRGGVDVVEEESERQRRVGVGDRALHAHPRCGLHLAHSLIGSESILDVVGLLAPGHEDDGVGGVPLLGLVVQISAVLGHHDQPDIDQQAGDERQDQDGPGHARMLADGAARQQQGGAGHR